MIAWLRPNQGSRLRRPPDRPQQYPTRRRGVNRSSWRPLQPTALAELTAFGITRVAVFHDPFSDQVKKVKGSLKVCFTTSVCDQYIYWMETVAVVVLRRPRRVCHPFAARLTAIGWA
jgi:hypothetical protein